MKTRHKQSGRTLAEMTVVIAAIVLLANFGLPAIRTFLDSFESGTGPKPVISAALASARAIAAREQRYAGIRFQKAYRSENPLNPLEGLLEATQYMVFIVHEEPRKMGNLTIGFKAVEGVNPMKLPDSVGVMDLSLIGADIDIDQEFELNNATAFSIIFSPSGKLVIHDVRTRNRDGYVDSAANVNISSDDVFSKKAQVDAGIGMFYQDDCFGAGWSPYPNLGLGPEPSRRSFVIYDRREFRRAYEQGKAYSGYLSKLLSDAIYINPYTGTMIKK